MQRAWLITRGAKRLELFRATLVSCVNTLRRHPVARHREGEVDGGCVQELGHDLILVSCQLVASVYVPLHDLLPSHTFHNPIFLFAFFVTVHDEQFRTIRILLFPSYT